MTSGATTSRRRAPRIDGRWTRGACPGAKPRTSPSFVGRVGEREVLRQWVLGRAVSGGRGPGAGRDRQVAPGDPRRPRSRAVIRARLLAQPAGRADARRVAGGGDRVPRARTIPAQSRGESASAQAAAGAAERGPLPAGAGQLRDGAPARRSAPATIVRATSATARCSGRSPKRRTGAAWSSPAARSRRSSGRCGASAGPVRIARARRARRRGRARPAERQAARRRRGTPGRRWSGGTAATAWRSRSSARPPASCSAARSPTTWSTRPRRRA